MEWVYLSYQHYGLINSDGEILAEINGAGLSGVWTFNGRRFASKEAAQKAAFGTQETTK